MKRLIQWSSLAALVFSLNSCGLPGALIRTGSNLVKGVGSLASSAASL